ncbi:hypothetical protein Lal_00021786 [Lupinus albus]|nr:hypothetical protein Lal_00021786 [Lupinus albus]
MSDQILSPRRSRLNWTTLETLIFPQEYANVLNEMEGDDEDLTLRIEKLISTPKNPPWDKIEK